jgi:hypothetical protein
LCSQNKDKDKDKDTNKDNDKQEDKQDEKNKDKDKDKRQSKDKAKTRRRHDKGMSGVSTAEFACPRISHRLPILFVSALCAPQRGTQRTATRRIGSLRDATKHDKKSTNEKKACHEVQMTTKRDKTKQQQRPKQDTTKQYPPHQDTSRQAHKAQEREFVNFFKIIFSFFKF